MSGIIKKGAPKTPRVTVVVTQEHIDLAEPRDSGHCMIADAVKAAVPDAKAVSVDLQTIRWTDPKAGRRFVFLTPRCAQIALVRFDQGVHTEPFSFKLRGGQSIRAGSIPKAFSASERKKLVKPKGATGQNTCVPEVSGGQAPPIGALASGAGVPGRRRAFGLRGFEA